MKKFLKAFFSTSNEINENIAVGVVLVGIFIAATFMDVSSDKYYTLAILTASFFGLGALKK